MKKYLMTVMAAVTLGGVYAGCSKDADLEGAKSIEDTIIQTYENAFITRFGQPAADQTWGFGEDVATTRGVNANGNMWASEEGGNWKVPTQLTEEQKEVVRQYFQQVRDPDYIDPQWTDYFIQQVYKGGTKCKNNGDNNSQTTEKYQSANNGWVVGSDHMDHLAACNDDGSIKDHIYNYNNGTCSTYGNILNTEGVLYYDVSGDYHPDKIQLMVGSTTKKFGYFNSDGSLGHTEYTGLVGWETIKDWANTNLGAHVGDCLDDGWNRSFMGFDFEQVVGNDVYAKDGNNILYAKCNEAPENPQYLWLGASETDITGDFNDKWGGEYNNKIYTGPQWSGLVDHVNGSWSSYGKLVLEFTEATGSNSQILIQRGEGKDPYYLQIPQNTTKIEFDLTANNMDLSYVSNVALQPADANGGTFKISKIYLEEKNSGVEYYGSNYLLLNEEKIPYLIADQNTYCGDFYEYTSDDDVKIRKQYNGSEVVCLNWKKLYDERLSQGWLPVYNSNMKKWVKVHGGADHYYSDWIVTLTKAEKADGGGDGGGGGDIPADFVCRIIVEDLTVGESSDFDFNDVVFDVCKNGDLIIRAIGGELPLYIGTSTVASAKEVHQACLGSVPGNTNQGKNSHLFMRNTGWKSSGDGKVYEGIDYDKELGRIKVSGTYNSKADAQKIKIWVHKNGSDIELVAPRGKVASKVCVGPDYKWCAERQDIDEKYHKDGVKLFHQYVIGAEGYGDDWANGNAWYQKINP